MEQFLSTKSSSAQAGNLHNEEDVFSSLPDPKLALDGIRKKSMKESAPDKKLASTEMFQEINEALEKGDINDISQCETIEETVALAASSINPPPSLGGRRKKQRCSKSGFSGSTSIIQNRKEHLVETPNTIQSVGIVQNDEDILVYQKFEGETASHDYEEKNAEENPTNKRNRRSSRIKVQELEPNDKLPSVDSDEPHQTNGDADDNKKKKMSKITSETPACSFSLLLTGAKKESLKQKENTEKKKNKKLEKSNLEVLPQSKHSKQDKSKSKKSSNKTTHSLTASSSSSSSSSSNSVNKAKEPQQNEVEMTDMELLTVKNVFFLSPKLRERRNQLEAKERARLKSLLEKEERKSATALVFSKKTINPFFSNTTQRIHQAQQNKIDQECGVKQITEPVSKWEAVLFPTCSHVGISPMTNQVRITDSTPTQTPLSLYHRLTDEDKIPTNHSDLFSDDKMNKICQNFHLTKSFSFETPILNSSILLKTSVVKMTPLDVFLTAASQLCGMSKVDALDYLSQVKVTSNIESSSSSSSSSLVSTRTDLVKIRKSNWLSSATNPITSSSSSSHSIHSLLLPEKYTPKLISQYQCKINNIPGSSGEKQNSIFHFYTWLSEWKMNNLNNKSASSSKYSNKNAFWMEKDDDEDEDVHSNTCLVHGPIGVGKTASIYSCALELGFEVIEVNAAQVRSGAAIKDLFLEATQSRHVEFKTSSQPTPLLVKKQKKSSSSSQNEVSHSSIKQTLILFEEVDEAWEMEFLSEKKENETINNGSSNGLSSETGTDNGFFSAMKTLMRSAKCAIVLTANRVPNAFEKLKCRVIPIAPSSKEETVLRLAAIAACEGIKIGGLRQLIRLVTVAQGDIRGCLNALMLEERLANYDIDHVISTTNIINGVNGDQKVTIEKQTKGDDIEKSKLDSISSTSTKKIKKGYVMEKVDEVSTKQCTQEMVKSSQPCREFFSSQVRLGLYLKPFSKQWWQLPVISPTDSPLTQQGTTTSTATTTIDLPWSELMSLPVVHHLVPSSGPMEGGTKIRIFGEGFQSRRFKLLRLLQTSSFIASKENIDFIDEDKNNIPISTDPTSIVNDVDSAFCANVMVYFGNQPCSNVEVVDDTRLNVICPTGLKPGGCDVCVIVDSFFKSTSMSSSSHSITNSPTTTKVTQQDTTFNGLFWYLKPQMDQDEDNEDYDEFTKTTSKNDDSDFESDPPNLVKKVTQVYKKTSRLKKKKKKNKKLSSCDDKEGGEGAKDSDDDVLLWDNEDKPITGEELVTSEDVNNDKEAEMGLALTDTDTENERKQSIKKEIPIYFVEEVSEQINSESAYQTNQNLSEEQPSVRDTVDQDHRKETVDGSPVVEEVKEKDEQNLNNENINAVDDHNMKLSDGVKKAVSIADENYFLNLKQFGPKMKLSAFKNISSNFRSEQNIQKSNHMIDDENEVRLDKKRTHHDEPLNDQILEKWKVASKKQLKWLTDIAKTYDEISFFDSLNPGNQYLDGNDHFMTENTSQNSSFIEDIKISDIFEPAARSSKHHHEKYLFGQFENINMPTPHSETSTWFAPLFGLNHTIKSEAARLMNHPHVEKPSVILKNDLGFDSDEEDGEEDEEEEDDDDDDDDDERGMLIDQTNGRPMQRTEEIISKRSDTPQDEMVDIRQEKDKSDKGNDSEGEFDDSSINSNFTKINQCHSKSSIKKLSKKSNLITYWKEYENNMYLRQQNKTINKILLNKLINRNCLGSSINCKSKKYSSDYVKFQDPISGALAYSTCTNLLSSSFQQNCRNKNDIDLRFILDYLPYIEKICFIEKTKKVNTLQKSDSLLSRRSRRRGEPHYFIKTNVAETGEIELIDHILETRFRV